MPAYPIARHPLPYRMDWHRLPACGLVSHGMAGDAMLPPASIPDASRWTASGCQRMPAYPVASPTVSPASIAHASG